VPDKGEGARSRLGLTRVDLERAGNNLSVSYQFMVCLLERFAGIWSMLCSVATNKREWREIMNIRMMYIMLLSLCVSSTAVADLFLVTTSDGPGFAGPEEAAAVLENGIMPTFEMLLEWEAQNKIVAAGIPVGSRTFYLMVEANSHDEVDRLLRKLPAWGVFSWKVKPLQSLADRAELEREILKSLKAGN
jgi:hypothetical protein